MKCVFESVGKPFRCTFYWGAVCNNLTQFHPLPTRFGLRQSSGILKEMYSHEKISSKYVSRKWGSPFFLNSCQVLNCHIFVKKTLNFVKINYLLVYVFLTEADVSNMGRFLFILHNLEVGCLFCISCLTHHTWQPQQSVPYSSQSLTFGIKSVLCQSWLSVHK